MAQHIVEIARDAFPLGKGGELLDLFVGQAQAGVGALLFCDECIGRPYNDDEEYGHSNRDRRNTAMQQKALGEYGQALQQENHAHCSDAIYSEGEKRGAVHEEAGSSGVERKVRNAKQVESKQQPVPRALTLRIDVADVDAQEYEEDSKRPEPIGAVLAQYGIDQEEDGICEPDVIARRAATDGARRRCARALRRVAGPGEHRNSPECTARPTTEGRASVTRPAPGDG